MIVLKRVLLANSEWHFDIRSALIGAVIAWIIAGFIYARREDVKALAKALWAPIIKLRDRLQSSQEDRYVQALQEALRSLLLFNPTDPQTIFQPPIFLAPPPIKEAAVEADPFPPPRLRVAFDNLTEGYGQLLITGVQTSGRTTALAMALWQTLNPPKSRKPYVDFPLWIDLAQLKDLPATEEDAPLERLAKLASLFLPNLLPKWVLAHLQKESTFVVMDNWESLPPDQRSVVANWIADAVAALPNSTWIIATGDYGYGNLVEAGFVPVEIQPTVSPDVGEALYTGWAAMLQPEQAAEVPEVVRQTMRWAREAGATLLEMNLRIVLYLRTGQLPTLPIEVMDYLLDTYIPLLDLGEGQEEAAEQARTLALAALSYIAKAYRLENRQYTRQEINDWIAALLPEEEEQRNRVESAVRRLVYDSGLLVHRNKVWIPAHYLWSDFLTAWDLVADEVGPDMVRAHLYDPDWGFLLEFYAALGDASDMIRSLLQEAANYDNIAALLRAARWCTVAPPDVAWRKTVIKMLAQMFAEPDLDFDLRLQIGHSLALSAGEGARAFFLQALRLSDVPVRCVALRGIGWVGTKQDMALLESALQEPELDINISAVEALADIGIGGAARLLYQMLSGADEHLILPLGQALAQIPDGHEMLQQAADSEDFMLRRAAAHGLSFIQEAWSKELLERMAREDGEWLVRSAAEAALNTWEEQRTSKVVVLAPPKLEELDWLIAWAAGQGVGLGVGDAAMRMLVRAIVEGDAQAKTLGALTLIYTGDPRHLKVLETAFEEGDRRARYAITLAMDEIEKRYHVYQG